ncbi:hypothetical protein GCM10011512_20580 [Tersicoccus solisilvae]|uniref:Uncharacterized protein n=1 Tax=Tersicoccus solisilvae TaxID=1882339 RepID=A0ABQ1P8W5_9MICC|nr:hypothetical protein [Tersicoccus solisilvae]GGC93412.1 hypothetical protein GCM10011512_20580 [Tersicoccus solisilvae]
MREAFVGGGLLLSAFGPLAAIVLLAGSPLPGRWWNVAGAVLMLALTGLAGAVLRAARASQAVPLRSAEVRQRDSELLSLLGAQMVPVVLAVFAGSDPARQLAMVLYLLIFAVVYVRGRLYYLNPVLALAGYRIWELELENGAAVRLLSRAEFLPQRGVVRAHRLAPGVFIAARRDRPGHPTIPQEDRP